MDKLLIICGPTATGKTALAAEIAKIFNGELVSADSRQVYRGMDIVTAKERVDVPTWLYDVVDPDDEFSVSHWVKLARTVIKDIHRRERLPIVVGGTGLYIQALLHPPATIDIPPNLQLRNKLAVLSVRQLQGMIDRGNMNDSDWHNPRRLIRRIEIGSKSSKIQYHEQYDTLTIGLTASISVLDERIENRMEQREQNGLSKEIASLREKYDNNLPSMSAIGVNEHAYARKQLTWFKKQKNILWFDIIDTEWKSRIVSAVSVWYEN